MIARNRLGRKSTPSIDEFERLRPVSTVVPFPAFDFSPLAEDASITWGQPASDASATTHRHSESKRPPRHEPNGGENMPAAQPKPHWKQCAAFLFSFVFLALRLSAMEDARPAGDGEATPTPLRVTAVAQKERFSLLEPVVLRVEVENPGADVAHLPNAWSADRRIFDLTARRLDGDGGPARPRSTTLAEAAKRTPIIITGNGSSVRSIPAGERIVGDARANLYCDMTVPGEYEINVEVVHYARPPLGPNGADETLNPPRVDRARPVRVVVDPEVAPEEPAPSGDRGATSAVGDKMIEVELATTKASFVQSEPIPIRVTISNIGEQPIEIPRSPRPFGLTARFLSDGIVWAPPKTLDCPATTAASRDPSPNAPPFGRGNGRNRPGRPGRPFAAREPGPRHVASGKLHRRSGAPIQRRDRQARRRRARGPSHDSIPSTSPDRP